MGRRIRKYKLLKKRHSAGGVTSSVFAGLSLLLLGAGAFCSLVFHGGGGRYLGAMGLVAAAFSVYGFGIGLKSLADRDRDLFWSKVGALANGIIMVLWLALFLVGIS